MSSQVHTHKKEQKSFFFCSKLWTTGIFFKIEMISPYHQSCLSAGGRHGPYGRPPNDSDSEDEALRQAIQASLRETHMNRSPTLDDYDPGIQSAIRESLDNVGGEPSRWSNNQGPQRGGPSSAPPPYPPRDQSRFTSRSTTPAGGATSQPPPYPPQGDRLYPRLHDPPYTDGPSSRSPPYPSQRERLYPSVPEPSAPPAEHVTNGHPGSSLPYPTETRMPDPRSLDEIRRRRIQRFVR